MHRLLPICCRKAAHLPPGKGVGVVQLHSRELAESATRTHPHPIPQPRPAICHFPAPQLPPGECVGFVQLHGPISTHRHHSPTHCPGAPMPLTWPLANALGLSSCTGPILPCTPCSSTNTLDVVPAPLRSAVTTCSLYCSIVGTGSPGTSSMLGYTLGSSERIQSLHTNTVVCKSM